MGVSVVISTYNSSKNLQKTLDSVKCFDEIIVCDMESTDNTVEIARKNGVRVLPFKRKERNDFINAKKYAIGHARQEWILLLHPDELVPSELRIWIHKFISNPGNESGVYVPRKTFIFNRFREDLYPGYVMRLFARDCVLWTEDPNEDLQIDGEIFKVPSNKQNLALIHVGNSVDSVFDRVMAPIPMLQPDDEKVTGMQVLLRPFGTFFSEYFGKGSFRYGTAGLIASLNESMGEFYRLALKFERSNPIDNETQGSSKKRHEL